MRTAVIIAVGLLALAVAMSRERQTDFMPTQPLPPVNAPDEWYFPRLEATFKGAVAAVAAMGVLFGWVFRCGPARWDGTALDCGCRASSSPQVDAGFFARRSDWILLQAGHRPSDRSARSAAAAPPRATIR